MYVLVRAVHGIVMYRYIRAVVVGSSEYGTVVTIIDTVTVSGKLFYTSHHHYEGYIEVLPSSSVRCRADPILREMMRATAHPPSISDQLKIAVNAAQGN